MDNTPNKYSFQKEITKDQFTVLTINVTSAEFISRKENIYNKLSQDVVIPGFRPGKAPRAMIEARISQNVYGDLINEIIPEITSDIIIKEKLFPLNQIKYEIVKYSDADGLVYKATFVNYPEIKMGDLSKVKIRKEAKKANDNEILKGMQDIVKYYQQALSKAKPGEEQSTASTVKHVEEIQITDDLVKSWNIGMNSVNDLKMQVEKELNAVNERKAEQEWLENVIKEIIKLSVINVPNSLIQEDVVRYEKDYLKKLQDLNLKLEDYLKVQNKTMDQLRKEWTEQAEKRFKEELLLLEIIKLQNLTIDPKEVEEEINKVKDEKIKTSMQSQEGKRYVSSMLLKQKAIDWIINNIKKD